MIATQTAIFDRVFVVNDDDDIKLSPYIFIKLNFIKYVLI